MTTPVPHLAESPVPVHHRSQSVRFLSPACAHVLAELRRDLADDEAGVHPEEQTHALFDAVCRRLGLELTPLERDEILTEIERDAKPFGLLQPLVDDAEISDIIVKNHASIAVQQGRRNFSTGLSFPNPQSYEAFVERLLQRAGASYSTKRPIADGSIDGFARVHAVHASICESGPYLTIRINRYPTVVCADLISAELAPAPVLDYLGALVRTGHTVMIVGEVGTGKTTLARALAGAIPPYESILVIEDTPEIRLEHPHVRYVSTREANSEGSGRITPSECIRAGMRMAMNRIIFGEVRDAEAAEAFIDVCASGHPGLSTLHARSAAEMITRLELFLGRAQRAASRVLLAEQIATAVQAIVFVGICRRSGKRRIMEVRELGAVADGVIRQREIFRYKIGDAGPRWATVNRVSFFRESMTEDGLADLASLPSELGFHAEHPINRRRD